MPTRTRTWGIMFFGTDESKTEGFFSLSPQQRTRLVWKEAPLALLQQDLVSSPSILLFIRGCLRNMSDHQSEDWSWSGFMTMTQSTRAQSGWHAVGWLEADCTCEKKTKTLKGLVAERIVVNFPQAAMRDWWVARSSVSLQLLQLKGGKTQTHFFL